MHGSDANLSNVRRCGYTMRFISTRVKFDQEKHGQYHHIYLARGRDHAGLLIAVSIRWLAETASNVASRNPL